MACWIANANAIDIMVQYIIAIQYLVLSRLVTILQWSDFTHSDCKILEATTLADKYDVYNSKTCKTWRFAAEQIVLYDSLNTCTSCLTCHVYIKLSYIHSSVSHFASVGIHKQTGHIQLAHVHTAVIIGWHSNSLACWTGLAQGRVVGIVAMCPEYQKLPVRLVNHANTPHQAMHCRYCSGLYSGNTHMLLNR